MKLTTIWTIPGMYFSERVNRTTELAAMKIAAALPAKIRYWTFIHVGSQAMPADAIVPEVRFMDLLKNAKGGPK